MIKKILLYAFIGVVITVPPLYYVNNFLLSENPAKLNHIAKNLGFAAERTKINIPDDAKYAALTYDENYISYVSSDKLYIMDVSNSDFAKEIQEDRPVIYSRTFNDRNIIMYLTYDSGKLYINTYDLNKDETREFKSIHISNLSEIKDVKYSSLTNVIYINVEIGDGANKRNKIYRIDIMNNVSLYSNGKRIENMALENNKDQLVYEDNKNNVYIKERLYKFPDDKKLTLLGIDKDNLVYLASVKNPGKVYLIKNGFPYDEIQIDSLDYTSVINKNGRIYLVYNTYIFDLISGEKTEIDSGGSIIDIGNKYLLYKDQSGDVFLRNI